MTRIVAGALALLLGLAIAFTLGWISGWDAAEDEYL